MAQSEQVFSQTLAGAAHARQHGTEWDAKGIGCFLMRKLADDHQQEGLAQFRWEQREGLLHLVREAAIGRIHGRSGHIERTITHEHHSPADAAPAIDHAPP